MQSVAAPRITNYREFWPYYLGEHSNRTNLALHAIGTTGTIFFLITAVATLRPMLCLAAMFSGYGFAWIGHFFFEKNRPATFKYPFFSLFSDFRMYFFYVTGQLDKERVRANTAVSAPAGANSAA
jgi:hypothetical protein